MTIFEDREIVESVRSLYPVWQHFLIAAHPVLTSDILWVINNEVAVPHYWEIHRQLTDFHSFIQILEGKDGREEKKKRRGFQWVDLEFSIPMIPCTCCTTVHLTEVTSTLHHVIIHELTMWKETGRLHRSLNLPILAFEYPALKNSLCPESQPHFRRAS